MTTATFQVTLRNSQPGFRPFLEMVQLPADCSDRVIARAARRKLMQSRGVVATESAGWEAEIVRK